VTETGESPTRWSGAAGAQLIEDAPTAADELIRPMKKVRGDGRRSCFLRVGLSKRVGKSPFAASADILEELTVESSLKRG
jgi:hypothetical protein